MTEKKQMTMQQKLNWRRRVVAICGFALYLTGAIFAVAQLAGTNSYYELRSDEYMNDPTIPYNERGNATYTFTDEWLSDTYDRLLWYVVPWLILFAIGGVMVLGTPYMMMKEEEVHKNFCKGGEARYCPECGLELSKLKE